MAVAISAALIGDNVPQAVQIIATGLTNGDTYTVQGTYAGGTPWTVRGGNSALIAVGTQLILVDVLSPINVAITYSITHDVDGVVTNASPVTVTSATAFLLASLDGSLAATFRWKENADPRVMSMRSTAFDIPGALYPVVRYDTAASDSGSMVVDTTPAQSAALTTLLRAGGIVVRRTDGGIRDVAPVEILLVTSVENGYTGIQDQRRWTLGYRVIGDPQPDVIVVAVDWDDFDTAYTATTWTTFDTEWSTQTWDQFDAEDWANH